MRTIIMLTLLFNSTLLHAQSGALTHEARQTIQSFAKDLKHVLVTTMKANGPVAAIDACNLSAPAIKNQHSNAPWIISRTSLKVRNPSNQPSDWLKTVLLEFEQRKQNGEAINKIEYSEQREDGWYFVKAIPTEKPCLVCHGSSLKPAEQKKLTELYPNDNATGFSLGDIRGAFVVKQETFKH